MLETFMANSVRMPVEHQYLDFSSTDSWVSEGVVTNNQVLESVFDESTSSPIIEPTILDQLEKQQNDRFYDFNQHQIPLKL